MSMYEETVRYHVLCEHELCAENAGAGDADGFSSPLNREQCNKVTRSGSPLMTLRRVLSSRPIP